MTLETLIDNTVNGLGFELVDLEVSPRARTLRVFIDHLDRSKTVSVDDCATVSNHLSRVLEVENVDYDRLEISSPGLDRVVKKEADFVRFVGSDIQIKVRVPQAGRRNFQGRLLACEAGKVRLQLKDAVAGKKTSAAKQSVEAAEKSAGEGASDWVELSLDNIDKARLVPEF